MTDPMYVSANFPWESLGFKKFTFKERELFETHLAQMEGIMSSYLCFSSLIMWDDWTRVYYMEEGSYLCLLLEEGPTDEWGIMPPIGPWDGEHLEELAHVFKKMERMFHENHLPFSCCELKKPMLPFVEQMDLEWKIWYARENSDYIFTIDDFCASFQNAKARYNIRYLEKRSAIRAESAGAENLPVYEALLKRHFCDRHSCSDCDQGCELGAMRAVLALGEKSGMETDRKSVV